MKIIQSSGHTMLRYAYLHGFASSPLASKATDLSRWFRNKLHLSLEVPDLNIPSFRQQSLTKIVHHVERMLVESRNIWCLIGSSFGGLAATIVAQRQPDRVHSIMLLAPAFDAAKIWQTNQNIERWKNDGFLNHYNPTTEKDEPVDYAFFQDLQSYSPYPLVTSCPISIIHGVHDEVVPVENSREYYRQVRSVTEHAVDLIEVNDDHHLRRDQTLNVIKEMILRKHRVK